MKRIQEHTSIYTLSDPTTGEVRYVGKTMNPKKRYNQHKNHKPNDHCHSWIESLKNKNLLPVMDIIDEIPHNEYAFWERHYISLYRSWGFDLTNLTEGGGGASGFHHTEESKRAISKGMIGRSPEWLTGRKLSKESIEKRLNTIAISGKRKPMTDSHKENIRIAKQDPEYKQRAREKSLAYWADKNKSAAHRSLNASFISSVNSKKYKKN